MGYQEQQRKERMRSLAKYIVANGPIALTEVIGTFSYEWGLKPEKIREYITTLKQAKRVRSEDGMLSAFSEDLEDGKDAV